MKIIFGFIVLIAFLSAVSCTKKIVLIKAPIGGKSTAPGQVKKQTGSQSAKQYAPGQRKKKN
jgi:hypothetical protein